MAKKEVGIVYLAAGNSSRFNNKPKVLAEIGKNGETFIEYSLEQSLEAGFNKIFFIVNDKTKHLLWEKFGASYRNISISYSEQTYDPTERDKPWGTVDALCTLRGKIECPFVVCNGDDLYGKESFATLYSHLLKDRKQESASLLYSLEDVLPENGLVNRGIFEEREGYISSIVEMFNLDRKNFREKGLSQSDNCSMGIFALYPSVIDSLYENLSTFKELNRGDRKKECLTGTEIHNLIQEKKLILKAYPTNSKWIGLTNPEDLGSVRKYLEID